MNTFESILLGALQGITEFLPISSSAHLIIAPWIFSTDTGDIHKLTYDVMLHFGTLFAILFVYAGRIDNIFKDDLQDMRNGRIQDSLLLKIFVGTIPGVVLGFLFKELIETRLRTPYIAVFTLVAVGLLMLMAERVPARTARISFRVALIVGIAQAVALVPGISRSGITIAVGLLMGLKRRDAVDFSFLLSIPIILGASLYESRHISFLENAGMVYFAGALSAFLFGTVSLKLLIGYLSRHSLDVFAYYRMGLAVLILLLSIY